MTPPQNVVESGSPATTAFRLYTNADANGHGFGDQALTTTANAAANDFSAYGSRDSATGDVVVVLINKRPDQTFSVNLRTSGAAALAHAHLYRLAADQPSTIRDLGVSAASGGAMVLSLSPSSATVVRLASS